MYPSELKIGSRSYRVEYQNVFKTTSSVRIKSGVVHVKVSRFIQGRKRDEVVRKFLNWAKKRIEKADTSDFVNPVYEPGVALCTHNKVYTLNIKYSNTNKLRAKIIDGNIVEIWLSKNLKVPDIEKKVKFLAEKLIIKDQEEYLKSVIQELNQLYFQAKYRLCRFKRMNHRFGSLSSKGNINIAYRLLFAPREIFRYVCLHELAHLKEFNHSKKFWALVDKAMPNYKDAEFWLRKNGFLLG